MRSKACDKRGQGENRRLVGGKSVKGNPIPARPGRNYPLHYDKNSVREERKGGVKSGAVHYEGDRISVSNHLEIDGDVDFKKGTVADGFSTIGIGSVKEVVSKEGSIYIKGGIAGKNKAVIKAKKYISINSNITAREIIIDSPKGQISGGNIQCETKVLSPVLGSPSEKRTVISVKGFNRKEVMKNIETLKNELVKVKAEVNAYFENEQNGKVGSLKAEDIRQRFNRIKNELTELEEEKKRFAYPGVVIGIKNIIKEIDRPIVNTTFYIQDGYIKEV